MKKLNKSYFFNKSKVEEAKPYFLSVEGREPLEPLMDIREKIGFPRSELIVSGSNYLGLKFWTNIGYNQIIYIEAPEENSVTNSVEIELARKF